MEPVRIELHYSAGVGYWAKIDGRDVGIYVGRWSLFCDALGEMLGGYNLLHGEPSSAAKEPRAAS